MAAGSGAVIAAVALAGRAGQPLYFRAFAGAAGGVAGADDALKLQLAAYAALDAVDERVPERRIPPTGAGGATAATPGVTPGAGFLGLLLPVEEFKVFGYCTPTNVKIIVVVRDVLLREDRVREMFGRLHRAYADAAAAPFAPSPDAPLTSRAFEDAVTAIVDASNSAILYTGPVPF